MTSRTPDLPIYTIGTSNRDPAEFYSQLKKRDVRTIVDVRSSPSSRVAGFNQRAIIAAVEREGLSYVWRGEVLGGRNSIETTDAQFLEAIQELYDFAESGPIGLFCAEGDPAICHRSYKIGAAISLHDGFSVVNILRDGGEELVVETLKRTRRSFFQPCIIEALKLSQASGAQVYLL